LNAIGSARLGAGGVGMSTPSGVHIIGLNTSTNAYMLNTAAIMDRGGRLVA